MPFSLMSFLLRDIRLSVVCTVCKTMLRFLFHLKPKLPTFLATRWLRPSIGIRRLGLSAGAADLVVEDWAAGCYTYARALKECVACGDTVKGKAIHCNAIKRGWFLDVFARNVLLDVYAKPGLLSDAFLLFEEMPDKNAVSFVTLMQGCAQHGELPEAVLLFHLLHREGHEINPFVLTTVIKLLVSLEMPEFGWCIHSCICKLGQESDTYVGTALIDAYSLCGLIDDARAVFDGILKKDIVSWSGVIACYAEKGFSKEALWLFYEMRNTGLKPNNFILCSLLKVALDFDALALGKKVHACSIKICCDLDPYVAGALLDLYAKFGDIQDSRLIFESIPHPDVSLWSLMIARYAQGNQNDEAFEVFKQMRQSSLYPNHFSLCSVLQASANIRNLGLAEQVHCLLVKIGFDSDTFVANALMDAYAKCKQFNSSLELFSGLFHKNEVSWNVTIVGYSQLGYGEEALSVFCQMLATQVQITQVAYSSALRACASMAALVQARQIHCYVFKTSFNNDTVVSNSLIDAYAKCGSITSACKVFDKIDGQNVVSWNAMISAYSLHSLGMEALCTFNKMCKRGIRPDKVTFLGVLSACSNSGLVDLCKFYFSSMTKDYGIVPGMEHYSCMVGLLGRSGHLEDALKFIKEIPAEPDALVWRALLGACLVHKNTELGEVCAGKVLEMDPLDDTTHTLLANMHARAGRWEEVALVRKSMRSKGVKKEPGLSWIEIQNKVHSFSAGDASHPDMRIINAMLEWLRAKIKKAGYIPDKYSVLHEIEDNQVEHILWMHSERLALAFGLAMMPLDRPVRIIKNLNCCSDCHTTIKLISAVVQREIIVRDTNRFHHFRKGICSCGDYC